MIAYRESGPLMCPVILCDACGKQITESGNVYWVPRPGQDRTQLWFTHKLPCSKLDDLIEAETGEMVFSEELDRWLRHLAHNFRHPLDGHREP